MQERTMDEMMKDPVLGKAFREIATYLQEKGVKQADNANNNSGNAGTTGASADNGRFREVAQDRPSPHLPTYTLAAPTPVNGVAQTAIGKEAATDLSWHRDLVKAASQIEKGGQEQSRERGVEPAKTQAAEHQHERGPQGRGR